MKTQWKQYEIEAKYTGKKCAPWKIGDQENWNHHKVTIRNLGKGTQTSFDFWASVSHPELTTHYDLLNAVYCFLSDATAAAMQLDEFGKEFGYTSISECLRTYKACCSNLSKAKRVITEDLYDTLNELQEIAG